MGTSSVSVNLTNTSDECVNFKFKCQHFSDNNPTSSTALLCVERKKKKTDYKNDKFEVMNE